MNCLQVSVQGQAPLLQPVLRDSPPRARATAMLIL